MKAFPDGRLKHSFVGAAVGTIVTWVAFALTWPVIPAPAFSDQPADRLAYASGLLAVPAAAAVGVGRRDEPVLIPQRRDHVGVGAQHPVGDCDLADRFAGGDTRLGVCLDSCHLLASGQEIRTADALAAVLDDCVAQVGLERLGSLHLNDSQTPLGSNVDRHANVGEGELGQDGCAVFLSEPRFEGLPLVLETPGVNHRGPTAEEILWTRTLRERGLAARRG